MVDFSASPLMDRENLLRLLDSYRRSLDLLKRQRRLYIGDIPPQVNRDISTLENRIQELRRQLEAYEWPPSLSLT